MSKVYVGNLEARTSEREIEEKFRRYGKIRTVYIPRSSPNGGFAFVDFNDPRDADDAVRSMNGKHGWRVELAKPRRGERGDFRSSEGGGGSYGGRDDYYRRDDRRGGYDDDRRRRVSRSRSRSPVRRGRSYSRSRSRSLSRSRSRDRSPRRDRSVSRDRSLSRSRSRDAPRDRSRSGSPPRDDYDNGHANGMDTDVPPRDGDKAE